MSSVGHDAGSRYLGNGREPPAAWLRSATMEDRGTPGTGERLTRLLGCGRPRWRTIGYPGNRDRREAHAAWLQSATMEDRGTQGTGERLTLHGCGLPR